MRSSLGADSDAIGERSDLYIINKKIRIGTERSHEFQRFRDISKRQLSEVAHDWGFRELKVLFLGLHSTHK